MLRIEEEQFAVIIALAKADDKGDTSTLYCLAIVGEEFRVSGKLFRLYNRRGSYIWQNEDLRKENLSLGAVIRHDDNCWYFKNTTKQMDVNAILSQLQFSNDDPRVVCRSIQQAFPQAAIDKHGLCTYDTLPLQVVLVSIKAAYTLDERIVFITQEDEEWSLKLNCRKYKQCTIDMVYLPVQAPSSEDDVGNVLVIKVDSNQAVCEGVLIRTPEIGRYDMKSHPHGKCVIINNLTFGGKKRRKGADNDHTELEKLFTELSFNVEVRLNLDRNEMLNVAVEFAKMDHSEFDSFVMIVMSHGGEKDAIEGVDGRSIRVEDLTSEFKVSNCPTLRGKPKLFFLQACRGKEIEQSSTSCDFSDTDSIDFDFDSTLPRSTCPQEADFLLAFSTTPGYKSCRHPKSGSVFIQVLVEVIRECYKNYHLLDMLTHVIKLVVDKGISVAGKPIQVPALSHTLRHQVWLSHSKDANET